MRAAAPKPPLPDLLVQTEAELIGLAVALAGRQRLSDPERQLAASAAKVGADVVEKAAVAIARGDDPLGDTFCTLRSPLQRRPSGATYTPAAMVSAMTGWAAAGREPPARVVDPGAGSGRFVVAAGRAFSQASLVAVETDPLAALLTRAHLRVAGLADRSEVVLKDYRSLGLPRIDGRTLFLGNPPYVRHHQIDAAWKAWLSDTAGRLQLDASQLAGLHVHFFLATALHGWAGDYGAFVTSSEWLDVNYGKLVRSLLLGPLGCKEIHLIEPAALPFADAATTAVITCFEIDSKPSAIRMRRVESLGALTPLAGGRPVKRQRLESSQRWTQLTRPTRNVPDGYVELGEICRVHRGQVTGANNVWIAGDHSLDLPPEVLFPSVTKAHELFAAGTFLRDASQLRRVIDLPADLDELPRRHRPAVEKFLRVARAMDGHNGFIASHRRAWWSVGLRNPAPILATYMARRPPAFVRNVAAARHINVAHGLYPCIPMTDQMLDALALYLSTTICVADGRTYAGGLTKFEPKEMERLLVPGPALL